MMTEKKIEFKTEKKAIFDFRWNMTWFSIAKVRSNFIQPARLLSGRKKKTLVVRRMRTSFAFILSGLPDTSVAIIYYILGIEPSSRYFVNMVMQTM